MSQSAQDRSVRIAQHRSSYPPGWFIEDDEPMPQSWKHDGHECHIAALLEAWRKRAGHEHLIVGRELPFRADQNEPRAGVDPDVYVAEKPPLDPDGDIRSVCTWKEGRLPPLLAVEIVSLSRPKKDYSQSPERHDWLGTYELWVFDPKLCGRTKTQPSVLLQLFQRETNNHLVQTYAGTGPMFSEVLHAWVSVVDGQLVISNDREGKEPWLTLEEEALQRADDAAKRADAERAEKERVLARLAELEALLAKRE